MNLIIPTEDGSGDMENKLMFSTVGGFQGTDNPMFPTMDDPQEAENNPIFPTVETETNPMMPMVDGSHDTEKDIPPWIRNNPIKLEDIWAYNKSLQWEDCYKPVVSHPSPAQITKIK